MTVIVEPDAAGVAALSGDEAMLAPLLFDELTAQMADQFPAVPLKSPDLVFDDQPWQQLPTLQDLEYLWLSSTPLETLLHSLAVKAHGDGEDLPKFVAQQRWLADMELELKRLETCDAVVHAGGSGADGPVGTADPVGGGPDSPGGPENGVAVVEGGKATRGPDTGRASKVSRRRGAAKAA